MRKVGLPWRGGGNVKNKAERAQGHSREPKVWRPERGEGEVKRCCLGQDEAGTLGWGAWSQMGGKLPPAL